MIKETFNLNELIHFHQPKTMNKMRYENVISPKQFKNKTVQYQSISQIKLESLQKELFTSVPSVV
jgi:hypothetical protein